MSPSFKKGINIFFVIFSIALIVFLFSQKKKLNETITRISIEHPSSKDSIQKNLITEKYNYSNNSKDFDLSFLEFGAKGCISCYKMEKVMEEVQDKYPTSVYVEFIDMRTDSGKMMGKYFNVYAIPSQVLLDKNGKEYFRHTGFLSFEDLQSKLFLHTGNSQ
mgnify:FL=1